jgi:hypothetical protein
MHIRKSFFIEISVFIVGFLSYQLIEKFDNYRFRFLKSKPTFYDHLLNSKAKSKITYFDVVGNSYDTLIFLNFNNDYALTIWKLNRFQNLIIDSIGISTNSLSSHFNYNFTSQQWGNFEYLFYTKPKNIDKYTMLITKHSEIYEIKRSHDFIYLFLKTNGLGLGDLENKYDFSIENINEKKDIEIILLNRNSDLYLLTLTSDLNLSSMDILDLIKK